MAVFNVVQKKINKRGEGPIYVTFYIDRKKIEIPAKFSIPPEDFDKERGSVKLTCEYARDRNIILSEIKSRINDIYVDHRLRHIELTEDLFWTAFRNPQTGIDFLSFCKEYQKLRFAEIAENTRKKDRTAVMLLESFKTPLYFDELTPEFFRKFVLHLRNKRGNQEITIKKTMRTIGLYLNVAVKKRLLAENPLHEVKLRAAKESNAVYLDKDEFKSVIALDTERQCHGTLQKVLEFFLFMCFTSLHIGDARKLNIDQVTDTQLTYMRMKTKNSRPKYISVPLSDPAKEILRRWIGNRKTGLIFEGLISDVKINKNLKTIGEMAGVNKTLTAKVGRHTFATLFLRETRDINTLKELLGHGNIRETLIYAHVLDEDRKKGISTFNKYKL